ncbi:MAG: hypothetical protein ACRYG5_07730 [Janthinobacterium lividum]
MADQLFEQFSVDEQEAFRGACLDAGLAPETFHVSARIESAAQETPGAQAASETLARSVTVQYGTISREYDGSAGADWTLEFADDIKTHVFVG